MGATANVIKKLTNVMSAGKVLVAHRNTASLGLVDQTSMSSVDHIVEYDVLTDDIINGIHEWEAMLAMLAFWELNRQGKF